MMNKNRENAPCKDTQPALDDSAELNHYHSKTLFNGQQEILIEHEGHAYRLRITRQNKLILTK